MNTQNDKYRDWNTQGGLLVAQFKECNLSFVATKVGRSTIVFSLYWKLSQGQMADFPVFIASKSFDL